MPKKPKIVCLKIHKGTKHKKSYMEGLNSKNKYKNIKGGGSP